MKSAKSLMLLAISNWGEQSQKDMVIEEAAELIVELAELIKVLQKFKRGKVDTSKIIEEAVDVELCLEQLKLLVNSPNLWEQIKQDKLQRLDDLLSKGI